MSFDDGVYHPYPCDDCEDKTQCENCQKYQDYLEDDHW